jgi:hypothetical protein
MTDATTHITTSGGLISAAFIDTIRELDTRQPDTEPESFAMPGRPPTPSPAALEDDVTAAWELMLERWDAIHDEIRMFDVFQVRNRWLLPLFQVLDFDPTYVRGDVVLDEAGSSATRSRTGDGTASCSTPCRSTWPASGKPPSPTATSSTPNIRSRSAS